MTRARGTPSPNTVCVPTIHSRQPWHVRAASRSERSVGRGGMKSAALPVTTGLSARDLMMWLLQILGRDPGVRDDHFIDVSALDLLDRFFLLAVLLCFVVLLAILMQAMVSLDRLAFGLFHLWSAILELLDEALARFLTMLAFGVFLRTRLP